MVPGADVGSRGNGGEYKSVWVAMDDDVGLVSGCACPAPTYLRILGTE